MRFLLQLGIDTQDSDVGGDLQAVETGQVRKIKFGRDGYRASRYL